MTLSTLMMMVFSHVSRIFAVSFTSIVSSIVTFIASSFFYITIILSSQIELERTADDIRIDEIAHYIVCLEASITKVRTALVRTALVMYVQHSSSAIPHPPSP